MRVYHFTSQDSGMAILRTRRVRLSRLNTMNDPFELMAVEATDKILRSILRANRDQVNETTGFICFSKGWQNPVQWSHYADRHRGLCLGFDVNDEHLAEVYYASALVPTQEFQDAVSRGDPERLRQIGTTKYDHWHYEHEMRSLYKLAGPEADGHEYVPFNPDLMLREIFVGANNFTLCKHDLKNVTKGTSRVTIRKVRPAFGSFRMVQQRNAKLGLR